MCLPGNSVLSSTKEDHQNKLLVTCYLLLVKIPMRGQLITADKRTCSGHNQAFKHVRVNTALVQIMFLA